MRIEFSKYGGGRHWEYDAQYRGATDAGHWFFIPAGTFHARPGASFTLSVDSAGFLPHDADWFATFYDRESSVATEIDPTGEQFVYIDVITRGALQGDVVRMVDMDLDVIHDESGVWVDDEDEFAEHAVQLGYPPELMAATRAACEHAHATLTGGRHPFELASVDVVARVRQAATA